MSTNGIAIVCKLGIWFAVDKGETVATASSLENLIRKLKAM